MPMPRPVSRIVFPIWALKGGLSHIVSVLDVECVGSQVVAITSEGQSPAFTYRRNEFIEVNQGSSFKECTLDWCSHWYGQAAGCRASYVPVASRLGSSPESYIAATDYSLPTELWELVLEHLIRDHAIAAFSTASPEAVYTINLSEAAWATYADIDGIEYLTSISNVARPRSRLLWDATQPSAVYVAEDHLGIRHVTNSPDAQQTAKKEDAAPVWWRTIVVEQEKMLEFKSDVSSALLFTLHSLMALHLGYQTPQSPRPTAQAVLAMSHNAEMVQLDLNAPGTTGYSTCWNSSLQYLHAHKPGERLDFYHELYAEKNLSVERQLGTTQDDQNDYLAPNDCCAELPLASWIHRPLNTGEFVQQVWISQSGEGLANLIWKVKDLVITSRTLLLGNYAACWNPKLPWICIVASPTAAPMRIFFSPSPCPQPSRVELFAAPRNGAFEKQPPPWITLEGSLHTRPKPLIRSTQGYRGTSSWITGILFRYKNGHQACVGSFKLDYTEAVLSLGEVGLSAPEDPGELKWQQVSCQGTLSWWFEACHNLATHKTELAPEIEITGGWPALNMKCWSEFH
ncbi:hypothetical protein NM208_g12079 [Fusarium decemcellulare]|uniref:Uncharacterized protein n=1 Tax=Fusarium decemcellulare TaxID=57161 RepID=A0ACC1RST6_9HYPO|nr:hypothetical protein NM208_g12079 [Fusarium decemcellulare]